MKVLTLNPGSSSLKVALLDGDTVAWAWEDDRWDGRAAPDAAFATRPDAVAVRFVHGGDRAHPAVLDDAVLAELAALAPLAPLHQPQALRIAAAVLRRMPDTPVVACFDTAFHAGLPTRARLCAIPRALAEAHGIRRYGFHGLSIAYAVRRAAELLGRPVEEIGVVVAHLGSGTSVTAVEGGASVDTSMGFSPLDGLPGRTRSGALDPAAVFHLLRAGMAPDDLERVLREESGLAGLSGTDGDLRSLLASPHPHAAEAIEVYLHRVRREVAAVRASLTRFDALVLTGGVAEHNPALCADAVAGLEFLGSAPVLAFRAREDVELARQARLAAGERSLR
ncbi:acetate/propionate family kinase [Actinokineospora soli]|uniref:Acetate kinase n=1 Tax=Actinokineospora soli TaxID=1048753 RepID=A0ABW2TNR8_9PSEU